MADERAFDIVVFGATGFTGGKTAEYLARNAPPGLRWAIAGRSAASLQAVQQRLTAIDPRAAAVSLIEARVEDEASLAAMAAQTCVLLTTVGPFIDYGEPVVRACIAQGTDYIDSTGEPAFSALLLERYAEPARERGVRVVPSCGYDAIPADLGAFFTVRALANGAPASDRPIRLAGYLSAEAKFSGGTAALGDQGHVRAAGCGRRRDRGRAPGRTDSDRRRQARAQARARRLDRTAADDRRRGGQPQRGSARGVRPRLLVRPLRRRQAAAGRGASSVIVDDRTTATWPDATYHHGLLFKH